MTIKIQKAIKFKNSCNCIVNYEELEKAIIWYSDNPVRSIKKIYLHGKYPAITIDKEKIHIHRLLMSYWLNTKIPSSFLVHHINGNKLDARKENLAIIFISTHQSKHNKGKIISEKQKEIIRQNNHKRKGLKRGITRKDVSYQKIWQLHQKGYNVNKISKELSYDWQQVKIRINEIYENPELLEEGE